MKSQRRARLKRISSRFVVRQSDPAKQNVTNPWRIERHDVMIKTAARVPRLTKGGREIRIRACADVLGTQQLAQKLVGLLNAGLKYRKVQRDRRKRG